MTKKKKELQDLRQKRLEGARIRSRAKWINEGEKPSNYFCNLENRNFTSKAMNNLLSSTGNVLRCQEEVLNEVEKFYSNLYAYREVDQVDLENILQNENRLKLDENKRELLEGTITYKEILCCLKKMSNNKSPGYDGFTVEFFNFFWTDIGYFLVRSINYAYEVGELSVTQKQGVITCIPKGNKDKQLIKNWRPISLLNVSYKLASACIANRLKLVLPSLIKEEQTGFLAGRFIAENIRLLYDIMFYTEKLDLPGLLLLIDFEKAFDSVAWSFIYKVLDFFNFGNSIRRWIHLFYNRIESCVIVNGHLSEWFTLQRGCRQGDPLSPYIFILCAEILAEMVRYNSNIKGIFVTDTEFKLSQYADDTTLLLDGSERSLRHSLLTLKLYASFSGLNINVEKTKVVWIGSMKGSNQKLCEEHDLCWEKETFTVLGVKFSINLQNMADANYESKLMDIRKLLSSWSKRMLTPFGKITVIKSLALSKISYLILALPNPSVDIVRRLQEMFFNFLWNGAKDRIKRNIVTQEYNWGGLRMIDVQTFINALKLSWIRRLISSGKKYLHIIEETYPFFKNLEVFGSDYLMQRLSRINNLFWRDTMQCFRNFARQIKPKDWYQFLQVSIWFNPDIRVGGRSIFYKSWFEKGIRYINDLFDNYGCLLPLRVFRDTYNIQVMFLEYEGLLKAVRDYLAQFYFKHLDINLYNPVCPLTLSLIMSQKKGCRKLYDILIRRESLPVSANKWQRDLDDEQYIYDWKQIYSLPYKISQDTHLRWFQVRLNHRILPTKYTLTKMNILDDNLCSFCFAETETLTHLFYDCDCVKKFWQDLFLYIRNNSNIPPFTWTIHDILFGNSKWDTVLNKIILQAKSFIYKNKFKNSIPRVVIFVNYIKSLFLTEQIIAKKNLNMDKFSKDWNEYKNLVGIDE